MTFVESLGAYLRVYGGLAALVDQRIYPVRAQDDTQSPYVVYRVSIQPENVLAESAPIDLATVTITACSTGDPSNSGYEQAHAVADQIRAALGYFRGALAAGGSSSEGSSVISSDDNEDAQFGVFEVVTTAEMYYQTS